MPGPRRIALINQKGGVGKTTTAANLGAALAEAGRRVLLIDLDPQSHLTMHFGLEPGQAAPSIYDVLTDSRPLAEAVHRPGSGNPAVVPSTIDLAAAEVELVGVVGREVILRDALAAMSPNGEFDYILLDCPPSLGLLTLNALSAAEEVFICLQPHFLALQGVGKLLETAALVRQRINPSLRVSGVVLCMYETGTRLAGEVVADLAEFLGSGRVQGAAWSAARIFQTTIRRNIKLAECPSFGQSIFQYAPGSHGAEDYARLAQEVIAMEAASPAPAEMPTVEAPEADAPPADPAIAAESESAQHDDAAV